jgi:AhpD family alkylhydroperoxidase
MQKRLDLYTIFPDVFRLYRELDAALKSAGINPLYFEMIKIRASQLNGCAYCLDKHIADALKLGEDPRKIHVLSAWREAIEWFNEEEQAILQLTEEITLIGSHGISDEIYNNAVALFGEEQYALLMVAAININSWNRIGVGLKLHPKK